MAATERALAQDRAGLLCRLLCQILGPQHPGVARTLHDLAVLCDAEGRSVEARGLWEEALALVEASGWQASPPESPPEDEPPGHADLVIEDSQYNPSSR